MKMVPSSVSAERIWPVAGVYDDVVVTRRGVLCMGWELTLPEMYSCTEDEYDEMVGAFASALRLLPPWSVVHRQDVYLRERWRPEQDGGRRKPFLVRAYDEHFAGRPYMTQRSYVFVYRCKKGHVEKGGRTSGIFGIDGMASVPTMEEFEDWRLKCTEFAAVMTRGGAGRLRARVLRERDWMGEGDDPGIVQRYMMLGDAGSVMDDIEMAPDGVAVGGRRAVVFSVGDSSDLPGETATVRVTDLVSQGGDLLLSNASVVGVDLDCEHVVNQIIVLPSQQEVMRALETEKNKMLSGIRSVDNRVNAGEIQAFLDAAYKHGLVVVRTNMSVVAWEEEGRARDLVAKVSTALQQMKVTSKHARYNAPVVWYAGAPGCACEAGAENLMKMELMSALCLSAWEGFDDGLGEGYLQLADRFRRVPVRLDMHRIAQRNKLITNYNIFILGTSGSGKSFVTSLLSAENYYAGNTEFIIDAGGSYDGLSSVIREESGGRDGAYMSWDEEHPLTFDAFSGWERWLTEDGALAVEEGSDYFLALLKMIYQPDDKADNKGWSDQRSTVLVQTVTEFLSLPHPRKPVFDDYYRYINDVVLPKVKYESSYEKITISSEDPDHIRKSEEIKELLEEDYRRNGYWCGNEHVRLSTFDAGSFAMALQGYARGGIHGKLLNDPDPVDYFTKRHVVIDVQELAHQQDEKYYGVCILSIMNQIDLKVRAGGTFKTIRIDEAWQAIANEAMAGYIRELFKVVRKYDCAMCVITQELADILSSSVVKTAIIDNSHVKILLDQKQNRSRFDEVQAVLGLTDKDKALVLSMNNMRRPGDKTQEVFINWGGVRSAVYAVEVSRKHALVFESNHEDKRPLFELARERGTFIGAVEALAAPPEDARLEEAVLALPPGRRSALLASLKKRLGGMAATLMLLLSLLVPAGVRAQVVAATFDATQAANMIRQFIENKLEHAETLEQLGQQLAQAKKLYQFMDAAYKFTSTFVSDSQILKETYENYQYIRRDIEALQSQYQYYAGGGKLSPRRIYYSAMVVDRVAGDAYDEFRFLRDEVMSDKYKDLSHKDRMDLFAQSSRKFRRYHTLLGQVIAENYSAMLTAEAGQAHQDAVDGALGTGGQGEEGAYDGDADRIVSKVASKNDPSATVAGVTMKEIEDEFRSKTLAGNVIRLVSYVILGIALLLIPFNFLRSRSGEHQTQDAFFKIAAGLFIMAMVLQVLSIMLFNQRFTGL